MSEAPTTNELATRLSELWDAERATWTLRFDPPMYSSLTGSWCLLLEWTQERGNNHHADWCTHTWEFYVYTPEEGPEVALAEAVAWCEALVPWRSDDD